MKIEIPTIPEIIKEFVGENYADIQTCKKCNAWMSCPEVKK